MEKIFALLFFALAPCVLFSQTKIIKGDSCFCQTSTKLQIPAGYSGLYGTVIIEFEVDSICVYSNPVIIQSVSKELDEVALNEIKTAILQLNSCSIKCSFKKCEKRKLKQPLTFLSGEDN